MTLSEFQKQFMQGYPLTMTLRNVDGREFTAQVLVREFSGPLGKVARQQELFTITLVLGGPEIELDR